MSIKTKDHLESLFEWTLNDIMMAGGDGGATWFLRNYELVNVRAIITNYIGSRDLTAQLARWHYGGWEISEIEDGTFTVWRGQEGLIVTTNQKAIPPWETDSIITL